MTTEQIKAKMAELQAQLDKTELQTALDTIATLRKQHAESATELQRQVSVHQERLAKAMERETALKTEVQRLEAANKELARRVAVAEDTMAKYDTHPAVIAQKLKLLEEQEARIVNEKKRLKSLEPKE